MSLSSLRLLLLARIEGLLRRWLHGVTTQLETAVPKPPPDAASHPAFDPRHPAPPEHWVELVRQHAPHLLDPVESKPQDAPEMSDSSEFAQQPAEAPAARQVIEYRAEHSRNNPPPLLKPSAPRPIDVAQQRASRRPLRLEAVSARAMDAVEITEHSVEMDDEVAVSSVKNDIPVTEPLLNERGTTVDHVRTTTRSIEMAETRPAPVKLNERIAHLFSQVRLRSHPPSAAPAQSIRAVATQAETTQPVSAHVAANLPIERQQIRETVTSVPTGMNVTSIRTSMGQVPRLHQERTNVPLRPSIPTQTVLRPTLPSLNVEDVTPDRWPSLPDEPTESPRDSSAERQQRERLKREQEGGRWSE